MSLPIIELLEKLTVAEEETLSTLLQIKAFVASAPSSSLKNVIGASNLNCLFDCLASSNREQIEVTCFILSYLLPIVDPLSVLTTLSQSLQIGLAHSDEGVRCLALKELGRIIATVEGTNALKECPEIITSVVKLVGADDMSVAFAAVSFLSQYGSKSPHIARTLLEGGHQSNLEVLKSMMNKNDVVRYRVYEIACKIQSESQEMLDLCVDSGIIMHLVEELHGDDVLLRVTCCAILADMASSQHSLDYLEQAGVVSKMIEMLRNASSEPFSDLYTPGIIKFFGNLCMYSGPKHVLDMYPAFCDMLLHMLDNTEQSTKRVAVETIGLVGMSGEGKICLYNEGQKCVNAVKKISRIMVVGSDDFRMNAVTTMYQLLDHTKVDPEALDAVLPVTLSWYKLISVNPIETILSLCKQPFLTMRCSGMRLLKAVASCTWGSEAMAGFPSLIEYLLDRSTESAKEAKEGKYEIVTTLLRSSKCANIFGNQNYLKFRQFANEGPLYVEAQLSTAIEEA